MNRTIAAIDLGSNSFHLKIARANGDQLVVVDRMREMVQLAAGLNDADELSEDATYRALNCLQRFEQRLRGIPKDSVRVVGTNTLRRAHNTGGFLTRAEEALNHPIEVIAGREEARLIYLGAAHHVPQDGKQRLVVDIGGGSTEFIIGRRYVPIVTESLHMGCVAMSRRFFPDGEISDDRMRQAELAALQELEPIQEAYRQMGWDAALGASGTILTVERILRAAGWSSGGVTQSGIARLWDHLVERRHVDRLRFDDVRPARATVLPGGLAILSAILKGLCIEHMDPSDAALREGLLYDLVGRQEHADPRGMTIRELCDRYHVDAAQSARVERTALYLRSQVAESWLLRHERYGDMLSWAAQLHEIGLMIAHNQYHKHGGYLLQHSDLAGFSLEEQTLLSTLVRTHRRKFPLRIFDDLRGSSAERAHHLARILRVAVVLHRSRVDTALPSFAVQVDGEDLTLVFPDNWLEQHPLTAEDLAQEADYMRAANLCLNYR